MIKRLRRKIILINVVLISVVLLVVFSAFCVNAYRTSKANLVMNLQQVLNINFDDDQDMPFIGGHTPNMERKGSAATVTIVVDADEQIVETAESGASLSEEVLDDAVSGALESPQDTGVLSDLALVFAKRSMPEGTKIVFADMSDINSSLRANVLVSGILFITSLGVLLLISLWLSGIAVNPIEKAWVRQKQFVADASHELKTPLTVILANNNILMSHRGETVSSQGKWLESTDEEAKRMKKLIDQMLTLAKSDMEQGKVVMSSVNLSRMTEEMLLYFEPVAYEGGVKVRGCIEPDITVHSDEAMLRQLVQILLDNAVKYSYRDTEITLTLSRRAGAVGLSVNNYGSLIDEADMPHIFDRFYRADKARSGDDRNRGYGLGLAIAKNTAGLLGIDIAVASAADTGTTFTLTFPK